MGVVYRARDTRLNREVALKVLPAAKAGDTERRARLLQEARAASALRHPNIVTIYDIGEEAGQQYVVMELVEGNPLSDLIPATGMRVPEVLKLAIQIASALSEAHAAGIVHRDLKPANIMVEREGQVKVLDFGIAKLVGLAPPPAEDDRTRTAALTQDGAIIGSASYMSPEQAQGLPVDARSDIFSFGALLYEMLSGKQAFPGISPVTRMAAVVERDPPPLPEAVRGLPVELERVVSRCLRKDPAKRSQNIADVKLALEELREESATAKAATVARARRPWLWPAIAGVAIIAAAASAWILTRRRAADAGPAIPEMVRLSPDDGHSYTQPAISADGKLVAYVSDRSGKYEIWLQQVGGGQPIQVTHSARPTVLPQFLPDGTRILFATTASPGVPNTLEIVPAFGGASRVVTSGRVFSPRLSPDGRSVMFFELADGVYHLNVMPVDGGSVKRLDEWRRLQGGRASFAATWSPDSRVILASGPVSASGESETFAFPVEGAPASPTGIREALKAANLSWATPQATHGDRVLFSASKADHADIWELQLDPGSWRPRGVPRRLTFGTEPAHTRSVSRDGVAAMDVSRFSVDFHLIAMDWRTGHAIAPARRLTRDGRFKSLLVSVGDPALAYGWASHNRSSASVSVFSVDLASAAQTTIVSDLDRADIFQLSRDRKLSDCSMLPPGRPCPGWKIRSSRTLGMAISSLPASGSWWESNASTKEPRSRADTWCRGECRRHRARNGSNSRRPAT